jgi:4-hydroxy-tetrahydrodipicolinate synthase
VTSNVLPAEVSRATRLALDGPADEARKVHLALLPVHEAMFLEPSPAPVKAALVMRGAIRDVVRGPIAPCTEATRKAVAAVLEAYAAGRR